MKLLELFAGTGSVGKVANRMGYDVVSLDLDPINTPTIEIDILLWNYKAWQKRTKYIPDFIWASPPCNTYSPLVYPLRERNAKTAEPISNRAKLGTAILYRTLDIIAHFLKLNPLLGFCIENPRGMMRKDKRMRKIPRETTYYCMYGDNRKKPTDLWSNFILDLKTTAEGNKAKQCEKTVGVQDIPLRERYKIPARLIGHILKRYTDAKAKTIKLKRKKKPNI